jgi:hypothetical protein
MGDDYFNFAYSDFAAMTIGMSGVGIFPQGEETLRCIFRFDGIALQVTGPGAPEMRKRYD